jgi:hypothetical protein
MRPVTMLSAVLVVLVLLLAPYVRPWVTQRSQIAEANDQMRRLQQDVEDLTAEQRRWEDPAYVRAQARERLHFVMPGETGYVVLDDSVPGAASSDPRAATVAVPGTGQAANDQPWYATLWSSVRIAGDPTTEQARSAVQPPLRTANQPDVAPSPSPSPSSSSSPAVTPGATPGTSPAHRSFSRSSASASASSAAPAPAPPVVTP